MSILIKTDKLTKNYEELIAVNGIDLEIREGEIFSLLGVNGAGKTTLVKMLTAITKPTSGDAYICGKSIISERAKVKELIDISMQETAVARKLTVEENIEFYARLNGQSKQEIVETKNFIYSVFGLEEYAKKQAQKLSGGWQRKLSIALALVSKPKILFLDEPTLGLDVIARRALWKTILSLKGKTTIVLTTHYMEEAEYLSDRIGIMKGGRLLFVGDKNELYKITREEKVENAFIKIVEDSENE